MTAFDPTIDGEIDGYCDAMTDQPLQPATRFAEIMDRYDGDEWPIYFDAYFKAYRDVERRRRAIASLPQDV